MSVPFNCDGPVKVSQTDFDTYKSLSSSKAIEMETLFDCWFKETNHDGVRQLALRDALRQSPNDQTRGTYYDVEAYVGLGRFLNDLKAHDTEKTGKALTYRPKLLRELVDEFLYAAQHQLIPTDFNQSDSIDKLIEYLIPIVDDPTARQLFPYHSVWNSALSSNNHVLKVLADIVNDLYPEWLRNELWERLKARCLIEIDEIKKAKLTATPIYLSKACFCESNTIQAPALYYTGSRIGPLDFNQDKKDFKGNFTLVTTIIKFLESNLPQNILYLHRSHWVMNFAPHVTDEEIVFSCARRHIINCSNSFDGAPHHWLRFFYWADGLTMRLHPDDAELLTTIDRYITEIHSLL